MTTHRDIVINIDQSSITVSKEYIAAPITTDITHIIITLIYAFLKVASRVYLRPNDRARSLSTLIAVSVNKDTEHKMAPMAKPV